MNQLCPFCNKKNSKFIRSVVSPYKGKKYDHYLCNNCNLEFFTPLKFEIEVYEEEFYDAYKEFHGKREYFPSWSLDLVKLLKKNKIDLNSKNILEIGSGDGINFELFKKEFKINKEQYSVVELDKKSIEVCKKRGIKNIFPKIFDNKFASNHKKKYDIILFTEVLEHQINPKDFLDSVFYLLKKNGLVLITVPNKNRLFKSIREATDIPPHHFLRFDKLFFKKNFKKNLYAIGEHNLKLSHLVILSKSASVRFTRKSILWPLFLPIPILFYLFGLIPNRGEGLTIILTK